MKHRIAGQKSEVGLGGGREILFIGGNGKIYGMKKQKEE